VRTATAKGRVAKTKEAGFTPGKPEYGDTPDEPAVLVGFDLGVGKDGDGEAIYALRPIFRTADLDVTGQNHGLFMDAPPPAPNKKGEKSRVERKVRVLAEPGYAVGGVSMHTGLWINGLSVTFMRIKGDRLDPSKSYVSSWVGDKNVAG